MNRDAETCVINHKLYKLCTRGVGCRTILWRSDGVVCCLHTDNTAYMWKCENGWYLWLKLHDICHILNAIHVHLLLI